MARVVIGYGPNQKTSARMSSGFVFRKGSVLLGKLRTDVETAVRAGRVDFEAAGRLLSSTRKGCTVIRIWKAKSTRWLLPD